MKKRGNMLIFTPLVLSFLFTLMDVFVMKIITSHFIANPRLVILSFLEMYLVSVVTMLFIKKEQNAVHKH